MSRTVLNDLLGFWFWYSVPVNYKRLSQSRSLFPDLLFDCSTPNYIREMFLLRSNGYSLRGHLVEQLHTKTRRTWKPHFIPFRQRRMKRIVVKVKIKSFRVEFE